MTGILQGTVRAFSGAMLPPVAAKLTFAGGKGNFGKTLTGLAGHDFVIR